MFEENSHPLAMAFSSEAIITLLAFIVAVPPALLVLYNAYRRIRLHCAAVRPANACLGVHRPDQFVFQQKTSWTKATCIHVEFVSKVEYPMSQ